MQMIIIINKGQEGFHMRRSCRQQCHDWPGRLRGCGYRVTIARQSILDILAGADKHLSAEEIYLAVHQSQPEVGLATVYRTLEILAEMGLVARMDFGDGRARYELKEGVKGEKHHHHLVCTDCGRVVEYTDFLDEELELLRKTEKTLAQKHGFKITGHDFQFRGLCSDCGGNK